MTISFVAGQASPSSEMQSEQDVSSSTRMVPVSAYRAEVSHGRQDEYINRTARCAH